MKFALEIICNQFASPRKSIKNLPSFELWRVWFSKQYFSKWDKRSSVVIKNYYKTTWGNFQIPFPSWFIFNNVFSHENKMNSGKNKIFQKYNINAKRSRKCFFDCWFLRSFKIQWHLCNLELTKNFDFNLGKFKFWKLLSFSVGAFLYLLIYLLLWLILERSRGKLKVGKLCL